MNRVIAIATLLAGGCLDPLVDDDRRTSLHLLPPGAAVPVLAVGANPERAAQVSLNDGIDDRLAIIPLQTGFSDGRAVRFWSFGAATRAPAPMYRFVNADGVEVQPALVDALPGDPAYNGVHSVVNVRITDKYAGERIASTPALADAIELGLVEEPAPANLFVASPIVLLDGLVLDVHDNPAPEPPMTIAPTPVYGDGYQVGMFLLGGAAGVQPGTGILPTSQASFLRPPLGGGYDATRPVFQAEIQLAPPPAGMRTYTPLAAIVNVDVNADGIMADDALFGRNAAGQITSTTAAVVHFEATSTVLLLPLQFQDGAP